MNFEKNIYAEAISIIRKMFWLVVLFGLGGLLLAILKESAPTSQLALLVPELFLWATLAYLAHRYVLLPNHPPFEDFNKQVRLFFRRFLALSLISILPVFLLAIVLLLMFMDESFLSKEQLLGVIVLASLVVGGIIAGLMLSLYGTWLPASIMNDKTGFKQAGVRGRRSFFHTLGRLILGPALVTAASMYLFLAAIDHLNGNGIILEAIINLDAPVLLINIMLQFANCFATIITAVILSRAYLIATSTES